jgi:hypothetical protein
VARRSAIDSTDGPRRERLRLVYEEAEPQVVAHESGDVCAQALARAQPGEHLPRQLGAGAVVADEGDAAARLDRARRRLGGVVQQRAPAQCLAAAEPVGERLGEQRCQRIALRTDRGLGLRAGGAAGRGQLDGSLEHLEGVLVDVCVVEVALLDAAQRVELGQHDGQRAELCDQLDAGARGGRGDRPAQLEEDPLARDGGERVRVQAGAAPGLLVGRQPELDCDAGQAQHAQRVLLEGAGTGQAQPSRVQVGDAVERVDRLAACERLGDRVDGEVAQREILREGRGAQRLDVELPAAVARDDAPGAKLRREREAGGLPCGPRDGLGGGGGVPCDDDVVVGALAPQQAIAYGAADEPRRLLCERCAGGLQGGAHDAAPPSDGACSGTPSRWWMRVTRAVRPQLIS